MSNDIDIGQFSEVVNNKMDRNMANQDSNIHHIISTYVNGTSGYRIWDDGYCEQWGRATAGTNSTGVQVSFTKTFKDANYNLFCKETSDASSFNSTGTWVKIREVTTTSFYIVSGYTSTYTAYSCNWRACGYLTSGQY